MNKYFVKISTLVAMALVPVAMNAQQTLTLEQCREMAIENNKTLKQAETKIEMAGYDRKIAFANYLPNISATGAYIYNANDIALVSDVTSQKLQNMGTLIHSQVQGFAQELMTAMNQSAAALEYANSPMWQTVLGRFRRRICHRQSTPLARRSMTLSIRICRIFSQVR
ncbi:MAG: TolC family protein [Anaerovoracaceae bacterium]